MNSIQSSSTYSLSYLKLMHVMYDNLAYPSPSRSMAWHVHGIGKEAIMSALLHLPQCSLSTNQYHINIRTHHEPMNALSHLLTPKMGDRRKNEEGEGKDKYIYSSILISHLHSDLKVIFASSLKLHFSISSSAIAFIPS
jgi:hypothetical protein